MRFDNSEVLGMLRRATFSRGRWIGPGVPANWIETAKTPVYWVAQRAFDLPGEAAKATVKVAADRHYDLFVNGALVKRRRGFFSGDQDPFSETCEEAGTWFRPGRNAVSVVVRSDPFQNKNYRPFQPGLVLEAEVTCGPGTVSIATDGTWEAAVVEGWREVIAMGGNGTTVFERVRLRPEAETCLSGLPRGLRFGPARLLGATATEAVTVYEWPDRPRRIDTYTPVRAADAGRCRLNDSALAFDLKGIAERRGSTIPSP